MKDKKTTSELVAAAEAFEQELAQFGRLSETVCKGALNSQKALERAGRALQELAAMEQRLQNAAGVLIGALNVARERQQAQAEAAQARAREIQERAEVSTALMQRFAELGGEAAKLGERVREIGAGSDGAEADKAAMVAKLADLAVPMTELAEKAQSLAADAREADFEDVARQADALRQQVLAARNKVALMGGKAKG